MPLQISPDQVGFDPAPAPGEKSRFALPFAEQIQFFQGKAGLLLPTEHWDDITAAAHDRAFMVAGAAKADLLADMHGAVEKAIAEGKSLDWFRKEFAKTVQKHGWDYNGPFDWRSRVIYQTNLQASYAAGRYAQLTHPDLLKSRPYWQYIHNDSVAHPRPLHVKWSGLTLRHDDPWWQAHYPPNGFGCRCRVTAVAAPVKGRDTAPDDGSYDYVDRWGDTHELPVGVDYGWDYAPGASSTEVLRKTLEGKSAQLPPPLAEALRNDLAPHQHIPVANALKLPKSGEVKRVAESVLASVDKVHSDGSLPPIPVQAAKGQYQGVYKHQYNGDAASIGLNLGRSVNPELTLAHELGHFIDHHGFGRPGTWSSEEDEAFAGWREAVANSTATRALKELAGGRSKKRARYYLAPWEQWARAYAQWLANRSGNRAMIEQYKKIASYSGGDDAYRHSQWADDDFEAIAQEIDKIFMAKRWLK